MKLKYITYEHCDGYQAFVVFDNITNHNDMGARLRAVNYLGAGFIGFGSDGVASCYGESESMKIKSRLRKDSEIINRFIG